MRTGHGNRLRRVPAETWLILVIMGIGAVLRLWRLPEIPFTHDEFSAILRTRFDSFSDLIRYGVRIDGHPAGVQVFLYYYIHWFGLSEAGLKLPFILAGTLSIGLIYLIGKEWFNGTTGLAAASFLAFLQYPVMYSQIARPYASGLFLSLLATWFWTRALFRPGRRFTLNLAGFVLTGTLCMYNHYFSFLFAGMVYLTGLFVCPRERRMAWFLSGPAMLLLFAPHIPIFLNQLGIGGVEGWLQKPRFDFLLDYLQYSFHFSVFVGLLVLTLISLALYWQGSRPEKRNRFMIISAAWFLIPWLTGYLYSIFRSSVLQYSVLIFSFPYLLFLVTGWFNTEKPRHQAIVAGLIALIVIPSLIIERRHYRLFYEGAYECIVKETQRQVTEKGADRCLVLLDTKPDINDYYLRKLKAPSLSFSLVEPGGSKGALAGRLDPSRARYLVFGALSSTRQE
ncbi:MAG TPA: glycosyltransferase family 39 protein, partial [Bacteroidales bacterium]|nr:glycosyltransferase family 39 protein [Bacteroidales bacterium]